MRAGRIDAVDRDGQGVVSDSGGASDERMTSGG
jgi:hypothetical protein